MLRSVRTITSVSDLCRCGLNADGICAAGCGQPRCGNHLPGGNQPSVAAGKYGTCMEVKAYAFAYKRFTDGLTWSTWCREAAGENAVSEIEPHVLPADPAERLRTLVSTMPDWSTRNKFQDQQYVVRRLDEVGGLRAALPFVLDEALRQHGTAQSTFVRADGATLTGVVIQHRTDWDSTSMISTYVGDDVCTADRRLWRVTPGHFERRRFGRVRQFSEWAPWEPAIADFWDRLTRLYPQPPSR